MSTFRYVSLSDRIQCTECTEPTPSPYYYYFSFIKDSFTFVLELDMFLLELVNEMEIQ